MTPAGVLNPTAGGGALGGSCVVDAELPLALLVVGGALIVALLY